MLEKFKYQIFKDFPDFERKKIYLAISGGKDSMVLSQLLLDCGFKHELLHCNFQLRGKESDDDELFIREYASKHNLELQLKTFNTNKEIELSGLSLQETARNLRYGWFKSFNIEDNVLILTAHHLDDAIETFFMNLLRGTGSRGAAGIPKYNPPYYRPLSNFTSEEIFNYIDSKQIVYREDSSNATSQYRRNNLRHNLIPQLLDLEPQFKEKMQAFFMEMGQLNNYLKDQSNALELQLINPSGRIHKSNLAQLRALTQFELQLLFTEFQIRRSNISEFIKFLDASTGSKFSTKDYEFLINRNELHFRKSVTTNLVNLSIENIPSEFSINSADIRLSKVPCSKFTPGTNPQFIDYEKVKFPLTLRSQQPTDKIKPLGLGGSKLISDILIDHKLSTFEKESILVLQDSTSEIVALIGIVISEKFKMTDDSVSLISISRP